MDQASTTPVDPRVVEAMLPYFTERYGNASSVYRLGQEARKAIDEARADVAIESADVVLVKNDPRDVARLIRLSQATMSKMRQNLVWATAYNGVAIPAAAGIFQPWGITLRPEWGVLFMAASTIIVAVNALLLRRVDLTRA